jgi:adenine-specific DNA-methyltransferase
MAMKDSQNLSKEKLLAEIERLRKELKKRKKYGLVWEDKPEEVVKMCKEKLPVLKEVKNKEIITDKNKPVNLLIEGDNYHALSVLNYTHAGKVDVIYIDPPYNTGNKDFIFNDRYVDREDAYRHSKWLSFMEKRLKLAKNLLKDTGVIFISIDDNEVAQLKILMDHPDLFGEQNFIAKIVWRKKYGGGKGARFFVDLHEYILCYAKNITKIKGFSIVRSEKKKEIFNLKDDYFKERGKYYIRPLKSGLAYRKNLIYPIKCPDGTEITTQWICSKETFNQLLKEERIIFKKLKNDKYNVYKKFYENDQSGEVLPESIIYDLAYNQNGKEEIKNIFGIKEGREVVFENAKPTKLIKYLITLIPQNTNAVVLDFMAGSGTTAHAVLQLNKEDGGNRKFILCTNNENNNGNGFKIAEDICYPRIKKVIEGYKNLKGEKVEGLSGNLKYFKTEFVDYDEPTDRNKIKLTHQATEMLCVKEGTFEKVLDNERFKIFKNSDHYTGIIWDQLAIPAFKKAIEDIKGKFSVYIFSLGDETFDDEFKDVKQKVKLSPIPEAILRVYRRIFK